MREKSSSSVRVTYPAFNPEELVARLRRHVTSLAAVLPIRRVRLFGSWATGRATAFSDIDVLIIYEGPPRPDAYRITRDMIPIRGLEPHLYTTAEAQDLEDTLGRMTNCGIELW